MKTSTEIQSIVDVVGEEKAIEMIAKAGFDAWDFSMFNMKKRINPFEGLFKKKYALVTNDYLIFARRLKQIGEENGVVCNQSHAPFPSLHKNVRPYLQRAIECTAEAGGKICVIHPDNLKSPKENAEFFLELLPFAKDYGVKIATENMWNWNVQKNEAKFAACSNPESFNAHLDAINDPYFVACLDLGHAEMRGLDTSAVEMIEKLGSRLQALHIHDNDLHHDSHQIPFSMQIDFEQIVKALKAIHYDGYFTLEADQFMKAYNRNNAFEGVKLLAESARKLADMYEKA